MNTRLRRIGLPLLGVVLLTSTANATSQEHEKDEKATASAASNDFDAALDRHLKDNADLGDVRIDVYWSNGATISQARVFGRGIGVWNRTVQCPLSRADILSLLRAFKEARFGDFPDHFGEDEEAEEGRDDIVRLRGRVVVTLGSVTKRVSQVSEGEQSKELAALAKQTLDLCERSSLSGLRASSLADGVNLLATGTLAPETFSLMLQRRADRSRPGGTSDGWILRVEGRKVTDQLLLSGRPSAPARQLTLSDGDFRALVKSLGEAGAGNFPQNLMADQYTDLRLEVLNYKKTVAARSYGSTTPRAAGAQQQAFDRLIQSLSVLHGRTEREGQVVASPKTVTAPKEKEREKDRD